jgi:nitrite reductase/ring-hydroxylating ferredoxin subunit
MSDEVMIATVAEIPEGAHKVVKVGAKEIGVFNVRGSFHAIPNACYHQNGPLCLGAVSGTLVATRETGWQPQWVQEGEVIVCPWHSLEFNIVSGQCTAYPNKKLPKYKLRVADGQIFFSQDR